MSIRRCLPPGAEDDDACEVDLVESHEIRVEIILPDDDAWWCPIDPFLAPSLDVEDLLAMKCSFSENWEWLPTADGGERLKNAMMMVSTMRVLYSSPSFSLLRGKKRSTPSLVKRHNEIFFYYYSFLFFQSGESRILSLSLSFLPRDFSQHATRPFSFADFLARVSSLFSLLRASRVRSFAENPDVRKYLSRKKKRERERERGRQRVSLPSSVATSLFLDTLLALF